MTFGGIKGFGWYARRNGSKAEIVWRNRSSDWLWRASDGVRHKADGRVTTKTHDLDIIAGPFDESQEMAGMTGYAFYKDGYFGKAVDDWRRFPRYPGDGYKLIDLSKVPASAIVRREPMRVTGWVNVHPEGVSKMWPTKLEAHWNAESNRIACIPIDVTEGDGL